jgi:ParB family chromosome partitioning protein
MSKSQKIPLSPSRDIPFNKLVLSQANVRRVKAGVSIEELAEDIARRGLLHGLSVRAIMGDDGQETGMFEIPAGGRRFRALELLVKQKRLAKTAPIPCVVREGGIAEEDSLAENVQRAPLHPLDQFRAFLSLREKGQSEEEIAAAFFVAVSVVKQRLKLASVSPKLLDLYAGDGLTLEQLMAFTVSDDHARQEQVYERMAQGHDTQPFAIRRMLTEHAVRASDKRAQFVGLDAYLDAGGAVSRDLFQADDGGWLEDAHLLDKLVADKLGEAAAVVRAEGWKWTETAISFPYGHSFGLRQLRGEQIALSPEAEAAREALLAELNQLEAEYADVSDLPDEVDARLAEIDTALETLDNRPMRFTAEDMTRAGAFVSLDAGGGLRIERGFVRPEDELPVAGEDDEMGAGEHRAVPDALDDGDVMTGTEAQPEEDEGLKPIPDRLLAELTAHRTLALRHVLGEHPDIAFIAALHALALRAFYHYGTESCLDLDWKSVAFSAQAPGLNDSVSARAIAARHEAWAASLPQQPGELWQALNAFDHDSRHALFAHVVSLSVNAVVEPWNRRPRAIAHADGLAQALGLDLAALDWTATVETFLGRVTKARILAAVAEARGQAAADRIAHLKKAEMADAAQALLEHSGWLPEPLRTKGLGATHTGEDPAGTPAFMESDAAPAHDADNAGVHTEHEPAAENDHRMIAAE